MKWVIAHDISDDKLRAGGLPQVTTMLTREIGGVSDANIRIYRICRGCLAEAIGIGAIRHTPDEDPCVIV